jgi:ribonuclease J
MQQNNNTKESVRKFSATPDDNSSTTSNKRSNSRSRSSQHRRSNRNSATLTSTKPQSERFSNDIKEVGLDRDNSRRSSNISRHLTSSSQQREKDLDIMRFSSDDTEIPESKKKSKKLPEVANGNIRIIPLGGVEEIGKNMTVIETKDDIIVIDAGLAFPGDEAPGVDYIVPDTTYLEERKHKIRGLLVTHAHLDHIGGIPYIMGKIGNPPIYTSLLTAVMIKKRQEEFTHQPPLNINVVTPKDTIKLGNIKVRFFSATHTIPDSIGIIVETPYGNIVITGDIKINHKNGVPEKDEVETFSKIGKEKTLVLIADSTNIEKPGFSFSERDVQANIKEIITNVKGRVIISTFASLFERLIAIIEAAEELDKKIVIEGRSMKTNIEIAKELGLLKVKRDTLISSDEIDDYPDNRIVVLATGAQGDEFAALMRIAQREHKKIVIKKGDTVMLSSSVVPGNEKAVQKLKDNLARQGAKILHYGVANVHSSGHSYAGELAWIHKMIKPKFFIPVHGHHFNLHLHADMAIEMGMKEENVVIPDNGSIIDITNGGNKISRLKDKASNKLVMVDGIGSNNIQEVVIRDRQMLAQDGMFVIIAIVDMSTGKIRKSPDIISRGFVYLKESQDLLRHARILIKKKIEDATAQMHPINLDYVKNIVREEMGKFLFQKTHKRPIILPVLIEV